MLKAFRKVQQADIQPLFTAPENTKTRRAKAWLDAQIARMVREGEHSVISHEVHPELAELLLAMNEGNRRAREAHVARLARARREGRWINTGHPIVVTADHKLRDGQHRLRMVIETGLPTEMDIRFGIDARAFKVMDTGKGRIGADVLHIEGYKNDACLAATARILWHLERGTISSADTGSFDNDLLLEFVPQRPGIEDACRIGHATAKALRCPAAPLAAASFLIQQKHGVPVTEAFFEQLRAGTGFKTNRDPVLRLREAIKDGEFSGRTVLTAMTVNAWNKHVKNRYSGSLDWKPGQPFPEVL